MKIAGTYTLHGSRAQIWPLINNPVALIDLIPGCDKLEQITPTEYRGRMQIPVAAVAGVYETCVRLQESLGPFVTRFDGEMTGPAGALRGSAWFKLAEGGAAETSVLTYEGQGMITGPLSRMDGRMTESIARALLNQGLASLDRQLQEAPAGAILAPVAGRPPTARSLLDTPVLIMLRSWIQFVGRFLARMGRRVREILR